MDDCRDDLILGDDGVLIIPADAADAARQGWQGQALVPGRRWVGTVVVAAQGRR